jgi:hypothetical protein
MSAPKITEQYEVAKIGDGPFPYSIVDHGADGYIDHYRTELAARDAAGLLNHGWAVIYPHNCIGCKVERAGA